MSRTYRVVGISGSLRKASYNTATLRAAQEFAPESLDIDIVTLEDMPLFNEDVEAIGWPDRVRELRERV
jgi:chromate reductase